MDWTEFGTMLELAELKILTTWCSSRAMRWRPISGAHMPAVLLEPLDARGCWERMVLRVDDEDFNLTTEAGEPLASASDLHLVLDALEGGVAESAPTSLAFRPTGGNITPAYVV